MDILSVQHTCQLIGFPIPNVKGGLEHLNYFPRRLTSDLARSYFHQHLVIVQTTLS